MRSSASSTSVPGGSSPRSIARSSTQRAGARRGSTNRAWYSLAKSASVCTSVTSEAGGLQGTAQNLGSSLGTAIVGAVLLGALATGFTDRISENPALPESARTALVEGGLWERVRRGPVGSVADEDEVWAVVEVGLLWLSVAALIVVTAPESRLASVLLVPYLAWVTFAAVLNYKIVELNAPF